MNRRQWMEYFAFAATMGYAITTTMEGPPPRVEAAPQPQPDQHTFYQQKVATLEQRIDAHLQRLPAANILPAFSQADLDAYMEIHDKWGKSMNNMRQRVQNNAAHWPGRRRR